MNPRLSPVAPPTFRKGRTLETLRFGLGEFSLGLMLVAFSAKGVCGILLGDDAKELAHNLQDRFPLANLVGADGELEKAMAQIARLVEDPGCATSASEDLALDIRGTAFQRKVWEVLRQIPAGSTLSYSEVAQRVGNPKAVRAVAAACAANALAIVIPCHRVIRNNGGLSGYRWGVERKRALLFKERAVARASGELKMDEGSLKSKPAQVA